MVKFAGIAKPIVRSSLGNVLVVSLSGKSKSVVSVSRFESFTVVSILLLSFSFFLNMSVILLFLIVSFLVCFPFVLSFFFCFGLSLLDGGLKDNVVLTGCCLIVRLSCVLLLSLISRLSFIFGESVDSLFSSSNFGFFSVMTIFVFFPVNSFLMEILFFQD